MYNVQCVQSVGYSKFRYSSSWGFKMWRFKIWVFKIWVFKYWVIKVRGFKIKGIQNLGIQNHGESKSGDSKSGDSKSRGFKIWGINGSVPGSLQLWPVQLTFVCDKTISILVSFKLGCCLHGLRLQQSLWITSLEHMDGSSWIH